MPRPHPQLDATRQHAWSWRTATGCRVVSDHSTSWCTVPFAARCPATMLREWFMAASKYAQFPACTGTVYTELLAPAALQA